MWTVDSLSCEMTRQELSPSRPSRPAIYLSTYPSRPQRTGVDALMTTMARADGGAAIQQPQPVLDPRACKGGTPCQPPLHGA